ncbi:hypothetical protein DV738_g2673, partial [Chaetothyriales sp. CBS 135597]
MSVAQAPFDPEQADNLEDMEKQFAVKAVQQMTTYWSILEKVPGSKLRLTRFDDKILEHFKTDFPEFDPAKEIDEEEMKSKQGKERWRKFCMAYEKGEDKVEDYNFGTILRKSPKTEYGEQETIFAVRMQFYAIEIARNRAGLNDWIYEQAQAAALVPAVCCSAISGGITPTMTIFVGRFFNAFADYGADTIPPTALMQRASLCVRAFLILGACTIVFQGASYLCWTVFGEMQAKTVRQDLFQTLLQKDIAWYLRELQIATSLPMGSALSCVIEGLASLAIALYYSWKLTLVIITAIPFIALTMHLLSRRIQVEVARENTALTDASKISNNATEHISLVKCFNMQTTTLQQYLHAIRVAARSYVKQMQLLSLQLGFLKFLTMVIFVAGFWYGNVLIHSRSLAVGQVVTTFWSTLAAVQAFQALVPLLIVFEKGRAAAGALLAVRLQLSFAYPARPEHNVLQSCSLRFPANNISFLLGKSGSGKSTIGNLILSFYTTASGIINIDGHELRSLNQTFLRNNITFVQQTSVLFNETLLRNLDPGREHTDPVDYTRINKCIHAVGLTSTISGMPEGLMTRLGSGGLALSGGQKQRVALGRALLRDTPILILDEPTSSLDNLSKIAIMENIRAWRTDKTTIVITHDTSLIESNDLVYVLGDGKVIAQGNWGDLADGCTADLDVHTSSNVIDKEKRSVQDSLEDHLEAAARTSMSLALRKHRLSWFASNRPSLLSVDGVVARLSVPDTIISLASAESRINSHLSQGRPSTFFKYSGFAQEDDKPLPLPPVSKTGGDHAKIDNKRDGPSLPVTKILSTVLPLLGREERLRVLLGLVVTMIQGVIPACFAFILTNIFQTFYAQSWRQDARRYSGILLAVAFGDGAVSFLARYLLESSAQEWSTQVRYLAMRKILAQPRAWFDQDVHSSSYLTTTLDRNAQEMRGLVGRLIPTILFGLVMATGTVVWALVVCWKLTLAALGTAPVIYALTRSLHYVTEHWEARGNAASEKIGDTFDETFTNIRTVRALTLESYFHRKYHVATSEAFSLGLRRATYCALFFGLSESSVNFVLALVFYYSAHLAQTSAFPTNQILHALTLLVFGTAALSSVVGLVPQLASVVTTSSRLIRLAQMQTCSHEDNGFVRLDKHDRTTLNGPIHFINTTFSYPTRPSVPVLRQLNLCIPSHQCTAIVGRSGSGKSTIASLLLGLYPSNTPATPPNLTLSGRDIRTIELTSLRKMVVLVPQTPIILPTTVRENITCGLEPMSEDTRQHNIEQAAIQAGIHEFITSLPNGYDTLIGDGGLGVSRGEAQRIVLARAIVRKPKILILDEPTSALDPESTAVIRQSIQFLLASSRTEAAQAGLGGGMTVIIITHARDMMGFADNMVVMEAGSVDKLSDVINNSPLLSLHKAISDIPSVTGDEKAVGEFLKEFLEAHNFVVTTQNVLLDNSTTPRYNIYAVPDPKKYGRGSSSSSTPKVLLSSHIDTVPPHIPYSVSAPAASSGSDFSREDILISGRGTVDDKACVAAQTQTVLDLLADPDSGIDPSDLALLFVVGEETSGDGMRHFSDSDLYKDIKQGFKAVLFGEPTELKLVAGHKGISVLSLTATGKAAHSGYPWLGKSANSMILPVLYVLDRLGDIPEDEGGLPRSELFGQSTVNVGYMQGGVAGNVVPEHAEAQVTFRLAGGPIEKARRIILSAVHTVDADHELDVNISQGYGPVVLDTDVDGFDVMTVNYGTDVPNLDVADGVKRYLYGPGTIFVAHSDHEALTVGDLEKSVDGYKRLKVTPITPKPRISRTKGHLSKRTAFVRDIVKEVAGLAPYERRVIELLRNSKDKRARKLAKKRLGTFGRAKRKVDELQRVIAESRRTAH